MADKNPKLDPEPGSNTEKPPEQWVSGDEPMTGAQGLLSHDPLRGGEGRAPQGALTKAQASKMIDELKAKLGR